MVATKYLPALIAFLSAQSSFAKFIPHKVVVGFDHTCALSTDGKIKCWGGNNLGQLGTGDGYNYGLYLDSMGPSLPVVNIGSNVIATDICAGPFLTDGTCGK